jgi:hypothetical protein
MTFSEVPRNRCSQCRSPISQTTDNTSYRSAWDLRAVAGSAKLYLKTGQFRKLVFGKEKDFDAPLSSLGPLLGRVACIDPAIPKEK